MKGRSICIVGASGDLGRAIANRLASADFKLTLTTRTGSAPSIPNATCEALDVCDQEAISNFIENIKAKDQPLYGLVYCAGIVRDAPISVFSDPTWDETFAINVHAPAALIRAVGHQMMVARTGRIILLGSLAAHKAGIGQAAYASSKAGLEALCRVAALEFGRYGITCNVIAPGAIESRMFHQVRKSIVQRTIQQTPLRRLGEPRHVAAAVHYLLSEDADFVTGQTLIVDGGLSVT